jgi:NAD(P)-dependent dehydrogenase (short-subunit alcohol dehydrogenase family)
VESLRSSLLEKQFRTNVIGMLDVTNAALPHLRASKSAVVVIVGSRSAYRTERAVSTRLNSCFRVLIPLVSGTWYYIPRFPDPIVLIRHILGFYSASKAAAHSISYSQII